MAAQYRQIGARRLIVRRHAHELTPCRGLFTINRLRFGTVYPVERAWNCCDRGWDIIHCSSTPPLADLVEYLSAQGYIQTRNNKLP